MNVFQLNSAFHRLHTRSVSQTPTANSDVNEPGSPFSPEQNQSEKQNHSAHADHNQRQGFTSQSLDINQIAKSYSSIAELLPPSLYTMSMQQLTDRAEMLRVSILNPELRSDSIPNLRQQLSEVYDVLERRSLDKLEQFLVTVDAAADNTLTRGELDLMSNNPALTEDTRLAASFLLGYKSRLKALDLAGSSEKESGVNISMSDIHARQLQVNTDIRNRFEPTHSGDGSYTVPKRNNQPINDITQLESPPRGQAVFNVQQDTVEQAMRTGEEVNFINSKGESISIKVIPVNDDANGNYNVTIDGHTVSVSSEIGISSTIAGITNMIEFGSAMGMPEGVRQFPDALVIKKDVGPEVRVKTKDGETVFNAGARYTSDHQLIFYGSEQWIHDAELYYHEIGHGLGRDINSDLLGRLHRALNNSDKPITAPSSMVDANPYGWQKIHDAAAADNNLVSNYASSSPNESFAEAFAAYIHAKNHGEVALQQFRETFPLQAEYIDKTIFGQSPG